MNSLKKEKMNLKMKTKKLTIAFEDKNLLIVDKPAKLLTIGTTKEKERTLYHEVLTYLHKKNQKAFIVNRIDKDTSGLVIFAKNEETKNKMQDNWSKVIRKYYAVCEGKIKNKGIIEEYLTEDKNLNVYATTKDKGKLAITKYNPLKLTSTYTLLDIEILTGRKNQIRVGLSNYISLYDLLTSGKIDKKYNSKRNPISRLGLQAYYLEFTHPKTNQKVIINMPLNTSFSKIFTEGE